MSCRGRSLLLLLAIQLLTAHGHESCYISLSSLPWKLTNANRSIVLDTTVPSHALAELHKAGIIEDPLYRSLPLPAATATYTDSMLACNDPLQIWGAPDPMGSFRHLELVSSLVRCDPCEGCSSERGATYARWRRYTRARRTQWHACEPGG
jgi:hypothetical protein